MLLKIHGANFEFQIVLSECVCTSLTGTHPVVIADSCTFKN